MKYRGGGAGALEMAQQTTAAALPQSAKERYNVPYSEVNDPSTSGKVLTKKQLTELNDLVSKLVRAYEYDSNFINEFVSDPDNKGNLAEMVKVYKKYSDEINDTVKEIKSLTDEQIEGFNFTSDEMNLVRYLLKESKVIPAETLSQMGGGPRAEAPEGEAPYTRLPDEGDGDREVKVHWMRCMWVNFSSYCLFNTKVGAGSGMFLSVLGAPTCLAIAGVINIGLGAWLTRKMWQKASQ